MRSKVVVVLSGGMDSTVLLHDHVRRGDDVRAITFDYGQRHSREVIMAVNTAFRLKVPHTVVDIRSLAEVLPGSSLTDRSVEVPTGHYEQESMKATVVPNRNMILLAIAGGHAIAHKADLLSYAAHVGDHAIYPDCREEFVDALDKTLQLADWHVVKIARPFISMKKEDICRLGGSLGVRFDETYSCYNGKEVHCGKCGTCVERREAFYLAQLEDPTLYDPAGVAAVPMQDIISKKVKN